MKGGIMQHPTQKSTLQPDEFSEKLHLLEDRISKLEGKLLKTKHFKEFQASESDVTEEDVPFYRLKTSDESDDAMESRIGEYGLSWLGNIVLLFGIIFLLQYIQNIANPIISVVMGYVFVSGVFALTYFLHKSFTYMAYMFNYISFLQILFWQIKQLLFFCCLC
jgi:hypothetical protein